MKVLVIGGHSTPSIRSRMMIDFLLQEGHDIVYETPEEVQERRSRAVDFGSVIVYDECRPIPIMDVKPKHKSNGPRDRWGKVK